MKIVELSNKYDMLFVVGPAGLGKHILVLR